MNNQIVISIRTLLIAALLALGGYIVYRLFPIFGTVLTAMFLVIALEPLVGRLMRVTLWNRLIPRNVAVLLIYSVVVFVMAFLFTVGLPPVISQSQKLILNLSQIIQSLNLPQGLSLSLSGLFPSASSLSGGVISITVSIFSNITALLSLFILSVYMSLDWENIKRRILEILPDKLEEEVSDAMTEIETNIGHWVKGELILMFVIGLLAFIGLEILGVKYSLALALVSGLLEIVPIIGPIISAGIAAIIGFGDSTVKGIGVIPLFIVIHQLENNLLVPKIMEKVSGFSPLAILVALLIGSEFFGIVGAILAVPIMMVLAIIVRRVLRYSN